LAKNIKLKIKNTQLAQALELKKVKFTEKVKKPKVVKKPVPPVEATLPPSEALPKEKIAPIAPKMETVEEKKPLENEEKKEEKPEEKKKAGPVVFKDFRDFRPKKKKQQTLSFDARDRRGLRAGDEEGWRKKRKFKSKSTSSVDETIRPDKLHVRLPIQLKELAQEMKLKASELISKLFMQGIVVTLNDYLDDETTVQLLGSEFSCEITIDTSEEEKIKITPDTIKEEIAKTDPKKLIARPPVVTFMGHVDHGKTSLIDAIRQSNLTEGESGAITQHIGAFTCKTSHGEITILDTPGHEAFSAMRMRGADVTDIVVLVVAGDEGIRDQTIEAINQAKEAQVPILVAINKSDKPDFNPDTVLRQLSDHHLLAESWGGETITVNCSALTKEGVANLIELLALQAEVLELKANRETRGRGTVIESAMKKGLGASSTVLIQNGTLRIGDSCVFNEHYGRIKTMHDEHGATLESAGPSIPVKITGLSGVPEAGSEFIVVENEKKAKEIAKARFEQEKKRELKLRSTSLESMLQQRTEEAKQKVFSLILRVDVQGSLEALKQSLEKIKSDKIRLNIISENVGKITESDIELAHISDATILGFHTKIEPRAATLIQEKQTTVLLHEIIYHAIDEIKEKMRCLLDKIPQENEMGQAEIRALFKSSQLGTIAGCIVKEGLINKNQLFRIFRKEEELWKGSLHSLKKVKEDVKEISKGFECGMVFENFQEMKEGDLVKSYTITYLEPEL